MPVRMTHPKHGTTFAVGAEVKWNEDNGWKVSPAPAPVVPVVEPVEPVEQTQPEEKKFTGKR